MLHAITISGAVTISPPGIASVCSGHQLELMCRLSATGMFLEWNFFRIDVETRMYRQFIRQGITANSEADAQMYTVEYNSTVFTVSRISAQESPVLSSRLFIDNVNYSLNGTVVTSVDVTSPNLESSTTTIMIINCWINIQGT